MPTVEMNIGNLERILNNVKNIGKAVKQAGVYIQEQLIDSWHDGKGLDGTTLQEPPISKKYGDWKDKKYGRRRIDMMASGQLQQSLYTSNPKATSEGIEVTVTVRGSRQVKTKTGSTSVKNIDILRGNVALRPNLMEVGDDVKREALDIVRKAVFGK